MRGVVFACLDIHKEKQLLPVPCFNLSPSKCNVTVCYTWLVYAEDLPCHQGPLVFPSQRCLSARIKPWLKELTLIEGIWQGTNAFRFLTGFMHFEYHHEYYYSLTHATFSMKD
jgi:hypothetical protein